MPRTLTKTYNEREQIEGPVRSFLARFIQVSTILDVNAARWRVKEFEEYGLGPEAVKTLRDWRLTMGVILIHVDDDIAQGAWRATARRLIRETRWKDTARALKTENIDQAKAIVLRTIARIYAELEARNVDEEEVAKAA